jgi:hypothetical protein
MTPPGVNKPPSISGEESAGNQAVLRLEDEGLASSKIQFVLYIGSGETELDGNAGLSTNVWYHVAATYDGSNMRIYINGIEDASKEQSGEFTANTTFYISQSGADNRNFDGLIDEVRVWSTARSQTNIRQGMYRENPIEDIMVLYFKFNEISGTTLTDSKGSNNGTLYNMDNSDWVSSSAFNTWLNTSSSDWSTTSNWSRGSKPSSESVGIYSYTGGNVPSFDTGDEAGCGNVVVDLSSD